MKPRITRRVRFITLGICIITTVHHPFGPVKSVAVWSLLPLNSIGLGIMQMDYITD